MVVILRSKKYRTKTTTTTRTTTTKSTASFSHLTLPTTATTADNSIKTSSSLLLRRSKKNQLLQPVSPFDELLQGARPPYSITKKSAASTNSTHKNSSSSHNENRSIRKTLLPRVCIIGGSSSCVSALGNDIDDDNNSNNLFDTNRHRSSSHCNKKNNKNHKNTRDSSKNNPFHEPDNKYQFRQQAATTCIMNNEHREQPQQQQQQQQHEEKSQRKLKQFKNHYHRMSCKNHSDKNIHGSIGHNKSDKNNSIMNKRKNTPPRDAKTKQNNQATIQSRDGITKKRLSIIPTSEKQKEKQKNNAGTCTEKIPTEIVAPACTPITTFTNFTDIPAVVLLPVFFSKEEEKNRNNIVVDMEAISEVTMDECFRHHHPQPTTTSTTHTSSAAFASTNQTKDDDNKDLEIKTALENNEIEIKIKGDNDDKDKQHQYYDYYDPLYDYFNDGNNYEYEQQFPRQSRDDILNDNDEHDNIDYSYTNSYTNSYNDYSQFYCYDDDLEKYHRDNKDDYYVNNIIDTGDNLNNDTWSYPPAVVPTSSSFDITRKEAVKAKFAERSSAAATTRQSEAAATAAIASARITVAKHKQLQACNPNYYEEQGTNHHNIDYYSSYAHERENKNYRVDTCRDYGPYNSRQEVEEEIYYQTNIMKIVGTTVREDTNQKAGQLGVTIGGWQRGGACAAACGNNGPAAGGGGGGEDSTLSWPTTTFTMNNEKNNTSNNDIDEMHDNNNNVGNYSNSYSFSGISSDISWPSDEEEAKNSKTKPITAFNTPSQEEQEQQEENYNKLLMASTTTESKIIVRNDNHQTQNTKNSSTAKNYLHKEKANLLPISASTISSNFERGTTGFKRFWYNHKNKHTLDKNNDDVATHGKAINSENNMPRMEAKKTKVGLITKVKPTTAAKSEMKGTQTTTMANNNDSHTADHHSHYNNLQHDEVINTKRVGAETKQPITKKNTGVITAATRTDHYPKSISTARTRGKTMSKACYNDNTAFANNNHNNVVTMAGRDDEEVNYRNNPFVDYCNNNEFENIYNGYRT